MIEGRVDSRRQARIQLEMIDYRGRLHPVDVVVDTGFNGNMTLPLEIIDELDLELDLQTSITLATGVQEEVNVWNGFVLWHNRPRLIQILETGGTPLLGMRLLEHSQLTIRVRVDGDVLIERLNDTTP